MSAEPTAFMERNCVPKGGWSRVRLQSREARDGTEDWKACPRGAASNPGLILILHLSNHMMTNLVYSITRRTPVSQKALKWAARAQGLLNEKSVIAQDRLNLAPLGGSTERPTLGFPFFQVAPMKIGPYSAPGPFNDRSAAPSPNVVASGSTKCRDLWSAHIVASFLRVLSEVHPDIEVELRDETGQFVIPMSVFIRAGRFEMNRDFLNAQRERALETSGDLQAGGPFLWAESRALNGEFLTDVAACDYLDVPEVAYRMAVEDCQGQTVGEMALQYVRAILSEVEPVASR